jgi:hypothetical protein
MSDVMDIARGIRISTFGQPAKNTDKRAACPSKHL